MNAETLIEVLQQIPDKKLPIRLAVPLRVLDDDEHPNYWLHSIFVHNKGDSGYEQNGEVTLWGEE